MSTLTLTTRAEVAGYMYNQLGRVAQYLDYPVPTSSDEGVFEEEVNQVLLECDASTPDEIADPLAVRSLAALYAWRRACADLITQYTFAIDGAHYDRSGVYDRAARCLARAETAALPYLGQYKATRTCYPRRVPAPELG